MLKNISFLLILFTFGQLQISAQDKWDVIIDADTGNEVDDPYALSRALIEPTWNVLALNAAHWQTSHWAIPQTMENSHRLNQVILSLFQKNIKTRRGGAARMYDWGDQAQHSAAAYEIIQQAKLRTPENPLNIVALGTLTNVGSAIYIDSDIADKINLFWLGTSYDFEEGILSKNDYNCVMDVQALDVVLKSKVELHIIPVNVAEKMVFSFEEASQNLSSLDPIGPFLLKRWKDHLDGGQLERVIWDLALISGIIHPEWVEKEIIITSKDNGQREIHYFKDIDAQKMKAEFFASLKEAMSKD